jgi:hypothetical protein
MVSLLTAEINIIGGHTVYRTERIRRIPVHLRIRVNAGREISERDLAQLGLSSQELIITRFWRFFPGNPPLRPSSRQRYFSSSEKAKWRYPKDDFDE